MPSSLSLAEVLAPRASLPLFGSVKPYAPFHSPLPNLGIYFCFCTSVPKYKIGNEPIPVCAAIATEKECPPPKPSLTMVEVIKSFPNPPNSSGNALHNKPCSPAFSSKEGIKPGSSLSIRSIAGYTSVSRNCIHISITICCSSLKSSGMNVFAGLLSLINHSPPFSKWVGIVVVLMARNFIFFN